MLLDVPRVPEGQQGRNGEGCLPAGLLSGDLCSPKGIFPADHGLLVTSDPAGQDTSVRKEARSSNRKGVVPSSGLRPWQACLPLPGQPQSPLGSQGTPAQRAEAAQEVPAWTGTDTAGPSSVLTAEQQRAGSPGRGPGWRPGVEALGGSPEEEARELGSSGAGDDLKAPLAPGQPSGLLPVTWFPAVLLQELRSSK